MRLDGDGLRLQLPTGWEGGITRNPARTRSKAPAPEPAPEPAPDATPDATARAAPVAPAAPAGVQVAEDGSHQMPVAHAANFALPAALDVFGSQAVDTMAAGDGFVALVEYGPEEVGTALFARRGLPRRLRPSDFSPNSLNRTLPDQSGVQVFATEAGRAFCLYVVVSGRSRLATTVTDVNAVLSGLEVQPR